MHKGVYKFLVVILMFSCVSKALAQNFMPPITWNKSYPYNDGEVEVYHTSSTSDMGYLLSGVADTTDGPRKAIVTKLSCIGVPLWTYRLGYMPADPETTPFAIETSASEVLAVFTMLDTLDDQRELAVAKLAANGSPQWMRILSGTDSITSYSAIAIKETSDGGYVVVGTRTISDTTTLRDVVVLKLASDGSVVWQNTYGDDLIGELAEEVTLDEGGNIYVTGETRLDPLGPAQGGIHTFVMRLDSLGNIIAAKSYGGMGPQAVSRSRDIIFSEDNNLLITGHTTVINGSVVLPADVYVMQVDTALSSESIKIYAPDLANDALDSGNKILPQASGGFVIAADFAGAVTDSAGVNGGALFFVDDDLEIESARFYNNISFGTSITKAMGEGYVVGGTSTDGQLSSPLAAKTDGNFNSGCDETPFDISAQDGDWRADTLLWTRSILADTFFFDTVAHNINFGSSVNCENIPVNMAEFDYTGFCWNEPFEFENLSTGDIQSYNWSFGDGIGFSMDEDPAQYMYESGGTYTVSLTVSYECVSSTFAEEVEVKKPESTRRDTICTEDFVEINGQQFNQPGIYEIIIPTAECDSVVNLFLVTQQCGCQLEIPNAYTPDGDGINDDFGPLYLCTNSEIIDYNLRIFSRWGEEVFASSNIDQRWDGRCDGGDCPSDVYVYFIQYTESKGGVIQPSQTISGDVIIIR